MTANLQDAGYEMRENRIGELSTKLHRTDFYSKPLAGLATQEAI
jgi:hypothetical protein